MNKLKLLLFIYFLVSAQSCRNEEMENINPPLVPLFIYKVPLYSDKNDHNILNFSIVNAGQTKLMLNAVSVLLKGNPDKKGMAYFEILYLGLDKGIEQKEIYGQTNTVSDVNEIKNVLLLEQGTHKFALRLKTEGSVDLLSQFRITSLKLNFQNTESQLVEIQDNYTFRPCLKLRTKGEDNCDTYRIPGIITTNKGTLIAVYDNRYNNSVDLQEDIDVGMSRSTDGGKSWEKMKVVLDMGEYGGKPQKLNGIGDPCILYDPNTSTIWVAGLWMSGLNTDKRLWWSSGVGMSPEETGQFILTKSVDDGLTWSQPINITAQIKDPAWQLLLQGPGMGITMQDGTLVFPAQFKSNLGIKAIDGGVYTCHSTIVYSKDKGNTWKIATGAKSNTTEAQVAQLSDGALMLNMRDDRNRSDKSHTNGRAVSVTKDLGKTWTVHPSSNGALTEPNCMASLIAADVNFDNKNQKILLFSNPNHHTNRTDITLKMSLDEGITWPDKYQIKLNGENVFGYSCLTMVDPKTIGILYEGNKDLYFQKIRLDEFLLK